MPNKFDTYQIAQTALANILTPNEYKGHGWNFGSLGTIKKTKVNDKGETYNEYEVFGVDEADLDTAQVLQSKLDDPQNFHLGLLDLDVDHLYVPSTQKGHGHLIVTKATEWSKYLAVLAAMVDAGWIEKGYYEAAKANGKTAVRLPWVKKTQEEIDKKAKKNEAPKPALFDEGSTLMKTAKFLSDAGPKTGNFLDFETTFAAPQPKGTYPIPPWMSESKHFTFGYSKSLAASKTFIYHDTATNHYFSVSPLSMTAGGTIVKWKQELVYSTYALGKPIYFPTNDEPSVNLVHAGGEHFKTVEGFPHIPLHENSEVYQSNAHILVYYPSLHMQARWSKKPTMGDFHYPDEMKVTTGPLLHSDASKWKKVAAPSNEEGKAPTPTPKEEDWLAPVWDVISSNGHSDVALYWENVYGSHMIYSWNSNVGDAAYISEWAFKVKDGKYALTLSNPKATDWKWMKSWLSKQQSQKGTTLDLLKSPTGSLTTDYGHKMLHVVTESQVAAKDNVLWAFVKQESDKKDTPAGSATGGDTTIYKGKMKGLYNTLSYTYGVGYGTIIKGPNGTLWTQHESFPWAELPKIGLTLKIDKKGDKSSYMGFFPLSGSLDIAPDFLKEKADEAQSLIYAAKAHHGASTAENSDADTFFALKEDDLWQVYDQYYEHVAALTTLPVFFLGAAKLVYAPQIKKPHKAPVIIDGSITTNTLVANSASPDVKVFDGSGWITAGFASDKIYGSTISAEKMDFPVYTMKNQVTGDVIYPTKKAKKEDGDDPVWSSIKNYQKVTKKKALDYPVPPGKAGLPIPEAVFSLIEVPGKYGDHEKVTYGTWHGQYGPTVKAYGIYHFDKVLVVGEDGKMLKIFTDKKSPKDWPATPGFSTISELCFHHSTKKVPVYVEHDEYCSIFKGKYKGKIGYKVVAQDSVIADVWQGGVFHGVLEAAKDFDVERLIFMSKYSH